MTATAAAPASITVRAFASVTPPMATTGNGPASCDAVETRSRPTAL
jgi:hypothetical protein